ncbi:hypothetical protein D3C85_1918210 [compost metagenome]
MQRIAALRDVEQGARQRSGHARTHQQTGDGPQDASAKETAAALVARNILQAIPHGHR